MLRPLDAVACEVFSAKLSAAACARRHAARLPSGRGKGNAGPHPVCVACPVGAERLAELRRGGWEPPRWMPFNIARDAAQKAARARLALAGELAPVRTMDDR